ncbi:MAG: tRNA(Ile)(2)-agmatinylcytidine synthase [Thermoplasmata archaeon]|nr:tRNA(Ile)(2)-agmatinylcytidine synthase [Thermoplasmata archaeon]
MSATHLAFDDTDSPDGMCTTYLACLMLEEFADLDLIGLPRLVRLNPNVPWKTRGNAAVCLSLGIGSGRGEVCGSLRGGVVRSFPRGRAADPGDVMARAAKVLRGNARFECDKTNPGLVVSNTKPPPSFYWRTVREVVSRSEADEAVRSAGGLKRGFKNGRGVIGAAAAMAWRPRDRTWEVIAYRDPSRFGTLREVDPASVIRMDKATKRTFNNYDRENGHVAITPASPCPILFGIRGDSPSELLRARKMIRGEHQDRWLLFMTNQGTEDHIVRRRVRDLRPTTSASVRVRVAARPETIKGGHVIVRVTDGDEVDAAFYEPSRRLRDAARALLPGDRVMIVGSVRDRPRSLNVEKLWVSSLVDDVRKVHNPTCRACGKRMGSMGANQGFRCKRCGARAPPEAAESAAVPRQVSPGWYEPPVSSRRHLHKPIRRMSKGTINKI